MQVTKINFTLRRSKRACLGGWRILKANIINAKVIDIKEHIWMYYCNYCFERNETTIMTNVEYTFFHLRFCITKHQIAKCIFLIQGKQPPAYILNTLGSQLAFCIFKCYYSLASEASTMQLKAFNMMITQHGRRTKSSSNWAYSDKTINFTCFSDISSDKTFEEERILMAVSSSKILP